MKTELIVRRIFIACLVAVFAFLLSPSSSAEEICWRSSSEISPHWISIDGIPSFSTPIILDGDNLGKSFILDRCIEAEIPNVLCVSKLSPLMESLADARYRGECRFDLDYDGVITLVDLGRAISTIISMQNTLCSQ